MISVQMFSNPNLKYNVVNGFIPIEEKLFTTETATIFLTSHSWSPHIWSNGTRASSNWVSCNTLALDFDNGKMTLGQAFDEFGDYWHIIGTTKNHMRSKNGEEPCHRFRVLLLLPGTITNPHYCQALYKTFSTIFPCDSACTDLGRWFFPCSTIESTHLYEHGFMPRPYPIPKIVEKKVIERYERPVLRPRPYARILIKEGIFKRSEVGREWGRNSQCYYMANYFMECGLSFEETLARVTELIKDWSDFTKTEVYHAVKSAYKSVS